MTDAIMITTPRNQRYLLFLAAVVAFSSVPIHLWNITVYHTDDPAARAAAERVTAQICRSFPPAARAQLMLSENPHTRALAQRCAPHWLSI
jgi:hypothetical protein